MAKRKSGMKRHSADQQKHYEREARLQWGPSAVNDSIQRWNDYSKAKQDAIIAEGSQIYSDLADVMTNGARAGDPAVVAILERWRDHLNHFYEPTIDHLRGLGQLYNSHPEFIANFQDIHPELPAFLEQVIDDYVDDLETAELERMLADDDAMQQRRNNLSL